MAKRGNKASVTRSEIPLAMAASANPAMANTGTWKGVVTGGVSESVLIA